MNTRQLAIKWWGNLTFEGQYTTMIKYKTLIQGYPDRAISSLTGREIELIYIQEKL